MLSERDISILTRKDTAVVRVFRAESKILDVIHDAHHFTPSYYLWEFTEVVGVEFHEFVY